MAPDDPLDIPPPVGPPLSAGGYGYGAPAGNGTRRDPATPGATGSGSGRPAAGNESRNRDRRRLPVRPSPVFAGMVAIFAVAGGYLWTATRVETPMRVAVFVFVAVGWTISLCVHEFAHAAAAWKGGDRSVEGRGYLTLDPRRYMDRQLSIVLPILIVLIGGIGLPGGAVMIDRRYITSRRMRSLVSGAGPLTNLAFAFACGAPLKFHWLRGHPALAAALGFLAFLEIAATVLNSLPIPGLDGFGVIAPWLPDETVASLMPIAQYVFFGLFILLFYSSQANGAFFRFCYSLAAATGVPKGAAETGHLLFTFWRPFP